MTPTNGREQPTRTMLRVDHPRELLAYLPHHLGFRPRESVVAVSLRRPRREVGLVARADLADVGHPARGPAVARGLVGHMDSDGAAQLYVVVYAGTDPRRPGSGGLEPERRRRAVRAAEHLRDAAAAVLGEVPVWVVTDEGYLELDCTDAACCPPGGRPLRELDSAVVGAHLVLAGSAVARRRADVARIEPAAPGARRAAARAARRWRATLDGEVPGLARIPGAVAVPLPVPVPDAGAAWLTPDDGGQPAGGVVAQQAEGVADAVGRAWRTESLALWRLLQRTGLSDPAQDARRLGRLADGLADRTVRDAVLVSLLPGPRLLPERMIASPAASSPELEGALSAVFGTGATGAPPPDPRRAAAHVDLLEAVVAHAPRRLQPPPLALLALLAWWQGNGARASLLVTRCRAADPAYTLALVLDTVLEAGLPPSWARREERATGIGPAAAFVG